MTKINFSNITFYFPRVCLFTLLLSLSVFAQASASTHYVAKNGTDTSNCGTVSSPCASVPYVLDKVVKAGDTIKLKAGTYNLGSETIYFEDAVNHANLTLTAADPSNRPLLKFKHSTSINIRINNGVKGVTLSHLRIKSGPSRKLYWGTSIRIDEHPTTIDHCEIFNGFVGIAINTGKNVIISNNVIHTLGDYEMDPNKASGAGVGIGAYNFDGEPPASGWHEKIYIFRNEVYDAAEDGFINVNSNYKYIEVAYNDFHHNYEDGIDWKDTQHVRIHHNKLHDNWGNGLGSNNEYPSSHFQIWNNEIYNNGWYGISIQGGENDQSNWKIWNNLIYQNCSNPASWGAYGVNLSGSGHEFYHNVVYSNNVPGSQVNAGIAGQGRIVNNVFFNNGIYSNGNIVASGIIENNYVYPEANITGKNAITDPDPLFEDAPAGNFRLRKDSPLIDRGINVGIMTDFEGRQRPAGGSYDIGAYESEGILGKDSVVPSSPTAIYVHIVTN